MARNFAERMVKDIESMSYHAGLGVYEGFRLVVDYLLTTLAAGGDDTEAAAAASKKFYHRPEAALESLRAVAKAFAEAVKTEAYEDHLGSTYMLLASKAGKQQMGQYFTPRSVASMMARMTMTGPMKTDSVYYRGMEPACGGGMMILAAAEVVAEQGGFDKPFVWLAIDLDILCASMCAVQLAAHNIPAVVIRGDSLRWGCVGDETAQLIWPPLPDHKEITQHQAMRLMDYLGHEAAVAAEAARAAAS